jgi:hypothetical protein
VEGLCLHTAGSRQESFSEELDEESDDESAVSSSSYTDDALLFEAAYRLNYRCIADRPHVSVEHAAVIGNRLSECFVFAMREFGYTGRETNQSPMDQPMSTEHPRFRGSYAQTPESSEGRGNSTGPKLPSWFKMGNGREDTALARHGLNRKSNSRRNDSVACPYRKRNAAKYNITKHPKCVTKPFKSMTHVL